MPKYAFLILLFLLPTAMAGFQEGCAAYEAGKYEQALKGFSEVAKDALSPELAYNLGCTELKLKHTGRAVLWFQRSVLLDPRHAESLQNLRFLKRHSGLVNFGDTTIAADVTNWFWKCFWIAAFSIAVLVCIRPKRQWPWITLLAATVLRGGAALVMAWFARDMPTPQNMSVVIREEGVNALNVPAETADTLIAIKAGSQVRRLETRGDWTYVELPGENSTRGWVRSETLEPLWPFKAQPAA